MTSFTEVKVARWMAWQGMMLKKISVTGPSGRL